MQLLHKRCMKFSETLYSFKRKCIDMHISRKFRDSIIYWEYWPF